MPKEYGIIVESHNNNTAIVKMDNSFNCDSCNACNLFDKKYSGITAYNSIKAKNGDKVEIDIRPEKTIYSSIVLFLFPVIIFVTAFFFTQVLLKQKFSDAIGALSGLIMIVIYYFFIRIIDKKLNKQKNFRAVISRILK